MYPPDGQRNQSRQTSHVDFTRCFSTCPWGDPFRTIILIGPATKRQRWHADNFVAIVQKVIDNYACRHNSAERLAANDLMEFAAIARRW